MKNRKKAYHNTHIFIHIFHLTLKTHIKRNYIYVMILLLNFIQKGTNTDQQIISNVRGFGQNPLVIDKAKNHTI